MHLDLNTYYYSRTRVLWHVAFWLLLVFYHSLIYSMRGGTFEEELMWEGVALPFKMGATYYTLYVLLPRYFMNRRFIRFAVYLALALLFAAFLQRVTEYTIINRFINPFEQAEVLLNPVKVLRAVIGIYPVVALAAFIKVGKYWYEGDLEVQKVEKEKLAGELKFLKAQIHPHFIFNTLNNLYALTLKKSDQASEVVLRLSNLLSYMLYEGNAATVPLTKELEVVETYLSLEQLRYGQRLDLSYTVTGEPAGLHIPPMLLLPFVENSFKHGVSRQLEQVEVRIDMEVEAPGFCFTVINSIDPEDESCQEQEDREGIGLANVKRRLELLYGAAHQLDITRRDGHFMVTLRLNREHPSISKEL